MLSHDNIVRNDFFCAVYVCFMQILLQLFCCVQIVDVHVKLLVFVCFLCRAAAYSKLGNYAGAVQDCERAISIDPNYSKAYGRMGYDSIFSLPFIVAVKRFHIDIKATNISHVEKMSCVYQRGNCRKAFLCSQAAERSFAFTPRMRLTAPPAGVDPS